MCLRGHEHVLPPHLLWSAAAQRHLLQPCKASPLAISFLHPSFPKLLPQLNESQLELILPLWGHATVPAHILILTTRLADYATGIHYIEGQDCS